MCLPECQPLTVFWPAPSVYADGVFSAHFTTRSSCVVYDCLFTWKAAFKNVMSSPSLLAFAAESGSVTIEPLPSALLCASQPRRTRRSLPV